MEELKRVIDSEVYQKLLDGNVDTLFNVLTTSTNELQELTNLPSHLVEDIKQKTSDIVLKEQFVTADRVPPWERLSTGCSSIDSILRGGVPVNGVTELFGCSGVGKTQLCLQLALTVQLPESAGGKQKDAVYICTEDVFPSKRLHQLAAAYNAKYSLRHNFENRVYLSHVADFEQLRRCLCVQLPQLFRLKNIGLVIIDSIAGVFRSENSDVSYTSRGRDIGIIATTLHDICDKFKVAVVCTNQVAENLETGKTEACLGLAWSNYVTCRFGLSRYNDSTVRELEVVFAPDLASRKCGFKIVGDGIE